MINPTHRIFEKRSILNTSLEQVRAFHKDPAVFSRLTPPPIFVQVHRDERASLTAGEIEFTLWFGPLPIHWIARHQPGPTNHSFADLMIKGPVEYWRHEHIFEEVPGGVALTDRVTIIHKKGLWGMFTRLMFDGISLHLLFFYRHLITRRAVNRYK